MAQRRRGSKATHDSGGGVGTLEPTETTTEGKSRRHYDPAWDDWKRPRRWPGILLSCAVVLAFIGVVAWKYTPSTTVHHGRPRPQLPPSSVQPNPSFIPTVTGPGSVVTTYHGVANHMGLGYHSTGDLVIMHAACLCQYNFVVTITDSTGTVVNLPVDTSGHFNGTYNISTPPGAYSISVVATGPWSVQILQPTAANPLVPVKFTYYSSGESVIGPFSAADRYMSFQFLSYTNGGVFVHVLDLHGTRVQTPFLARGYLRSTALLSSLPNPYYIEVDATGFWNLIVDTHR